VLKGVVSSTIFLLLIVGPGGCKKAQQQTREAVADITLECRNPNGEKKRGRFGPEWHDSEEEGSEHTELDGGQVVKAPPRPDLSGKPSERSYSVGRPNGGWLVGGRPLPLESTYHRILAGTARRGWNYGGEELVTVIDTAARTVAQKFPGVILRVGNMSRKEGGKIAPSVSHQSGRDADIGLYCTDLDNEAVDPKGFPRFVQKGGALIDQSGRYLFDTERNWLFVATLLSDPKARVQWIFLDTPLKNAMIEFAIETGASEELVEKAEKVIVRPENSSPHAEHFHLRIFCTPRDQEYNCRDYGPEWGWVKEERAKNEAHLQSTVDRIMKGEQGLLSMDGPSGGPVPVLDNQPPPTAAPPTAPVKPLPTPTGKVPKYERGNLPTNVEMKF